LFCHFKHEFSKNDFFQQHLLFMVTSDDIVLKQMLGSVLETTKKEKQGRGQALEQEETQPSPASTFFVRISRMFSENGKQYGDLQK